MQLRIGSEHVVLDKDIASSFNNYFVNVADFLTVGSPSWPSELFRLYSLVSLCLPVVGGK